MEIKQYTSPICSKEPLGNKTEKYSAHREYLNMLRERPSIKLSIIIKPFKKRKAIKYLKIKTLQPAHTW